MKMDKILLSKSISEFKDFLPALRAIKSLFDKSWEHQCFKHHKMLGTTADRACLLCFLVTMKSWKKQEPRNQSSHLQQL